MLERVKRLIRRLTPRARADAARAQELGEKTGELDHNRSSGPGINPGSYTGGW